MARGRQPNTNREINWVTDEDGNVLGYMKDAKTLIPITELSEAQLANPLIKGAAGVGNGVVYDENSNAIPLGSTIQRLRTAKYGWRNIANGVAYPKSHQGGGQQHRVRWTVRIRDTIQENQWLRIGVSTTSDNGEGENGITNDRNLSGTICQIDIEWPPLSGNYYSAYPWDSKTSPPDLSNLPSPTKVFDSTKKVQDFWVQLPAGNGPLIEDGFLTGWAYFKGKFPMNSGANVVRGSQASTFVGNLYNQVANLTTTGLALRDDATNGLTGMSNATRAALTSTDTSGAGEQWMWVPIYVKTYNNRTSVIVVSDSTDQLGGSSFSSIIDDSYTYGVGGNLVGLRHPVMSLSSLSDKMDSWANVPLYNAVRRSAIEDENIVVNAMGRNDYTAQTSSSIVTLHNAFIGLSEFSGKTKISVTIPAVGVAFAGSNDMEPTGLSLNSATKNRLNELFRSSVYEYCFDVDALLRDPANAYKNRSPRALRTVTGSITASGTPILTLTGPNDRFNPSTDYNQRCGNVDYAGVGGIMYAVPSIVNILSSTTAQLSYLPSADITNGSFVIGACPYSASPRDKIHHSQTFYQTIRQAIGLQSDANRTINLYRMPQSLIL